MPKAAVELISFPYMRGPRGEGRSGKTWLCSALSCPDLAGLGSAAGTQVAGGGSGAGESLGVPAVRGTFPAGKMCQHMDWYLASHSFPEFSRC